MIIIIIKICEEQTFFNFFRSFLHIFEINIARKMIPEYVDSVNYTVQLHVAGQVFWVEVPRL